MLATGAAAILVVVAIGVGALVVSGKSERGSTPDRLALPAFRGEFQDFSPAMPPQPAPDVAFLDEKGRRRQLSGLKGEVLLVNFWATWCAPCVAELPALARLKVRVPGMALLAVNLDRTKVDAGSFLKGHQAAPLGVLTDNDNVMMRTFLLIGMPTTLLIDPKGNVVARAEGPAEWATPEAVKYFKRITGS